MIPQIADNDEATDFAEVVRQLNVAKCAFQLRTIEAVLGCEATTAPLRPAVVSSFHKGAA